MRLLQLKYKIIVLNSFEKLHFAKFFACLVLLFSIFAMPSKSLAATNFCEDYTTYAACSTCTPRLCQQARDANDIDAINQYCNGQFPNQQMQICKNHFNNAQHQCGDTTNITRLVQCDVCIPSGGFTVESCRQRFNPACDIAAANECATCNPRNGDTPESCRLKYAIKCDMVTNVADCSGCAPQGGQTPETCRLRLGTGCNVATTYSQCTGCIEQGGQTQESCRTRLTPRCDTAANYSECTGCIPQGGQTEASCRARYAIRCDAAANSLQCSGCAENGGVNEQACFNRFPVNCDATAYASQCSSCVPTASWDRDRCNNKYTGMNLDQTDSFQAINRYDSGSYDICDNVTSITYCSTCVPNPRPSDCYVTNGYISTTKAAACMNEVRAARQSCTSRLTPTPLGPADEYVYTSKECSVNSQAFYDGHDKFKALNQAKAYYCDAHVSDTQMKLNCERSLNRAAAKRASLGNCYYIEAYEAYYVDNGIFNSWFNECQNLEKDGVRPNCFNGMGTDGSWNLGDGSGFDADFLARKKICETPKDGGARYKPTISFQVVREPGCVDKDKNGGKCPGCYETRFNNTTDPGNKERDIRSATINGNVLHPDLIKSRGCLPSSKTLNFDLGGLSGGDKAAVASKLMALGYDLSKLDIKAIINDPAKIFPALLDLALPACIVNPIPVDAKFDKFETTAPVTGGKTAADVQADVDSQFKDASDGKISWRGNCGRGIFLYEGQAPLNSNIMKNVTVDATTGNVVSSTPTGSNLANVVNVDPAARLNDKGDIWASRTGCFNPEERFVHLPAFNKVTTLRDFAQSSGAPSDVLKYIPNSILFKPTNKEVEKIKIDVTVPTTTRTASVDFNSALSAISTLTTTGLAIDDPINTSGTGLWFVPNDRLLSRHPLCERLSNSNTYFDFYDILGEVLKGNASSIDLANAMNLIKSGMASASKKRDYTQEDIDRVNNGELPMCYVDDKLDDMNDFCRYYTDSRNFSLGSSNFSKTFMETMTGEAVPTGAQKISISPYLGEKYVFNFKNYCWESKLAPIYKVPDPYDTWMPPAIRLADSVLKTRTAKNDDGTVKMDTSVTPPRPAKDYEVQPTIFKDIYDKEHKFLQTDYVRRTFTPYAARFTTDSMVPINRGTAGEKAHAIKSLEEYGYDGFPLLRTDSAYNPVSIYDPQPNAAALVADYDDPNKVGKKYKYQQCLRAYIEQWAFEGDKGYIVLDTSPTSGFIPDASMCQWVAYYNTSENNRNINNDGKMGRRSDFVVTMSYFFVLKGLISPVDMAIDAAKDLFLGGAEKIDISAIVPTDMSLNLIPKDGGWLDGKEGLKRPAKADYQNIPLMTGMRSEQYDNANFLSTGNVTSSHELLDSDALDPLKLADDALSTLGDPDNVHYKKIITEGDLTQGTQVADGDPLNFKLYNRNIVRMVDKFIGDKSKIANQKMIYAQYDQSKRDCVTEPITNYTKDVIDPGFQNCDLNAGSKVFKNFFGALFKKSETDPSKSEIELLSENLGNEDEGKLGQTPSKTDTGGLFGKMFKDPDGIGAIFGQSEVDDIIAGRKSPDVELHWLTTKVTKDFFSLVTVVPKLPVFAYGFDFVTKDKDGKSPPPTPSDGEEKTVPIVYFKKNWLEYDDNGLLGKNFEILDVWMSRMGGNATFGYHLVQRPAGNYKTQTYARNAKLGMPVFNVGKDSGGKFSLSGRDWVEHTWPAASCMHGQPVEPISLAEYWKLAPGQSKFGRNLIFDSWWVHDDIRADQFRQLSIILKEGVKDPADSTKYLPGKEPFKWLITQTNTSGPNAGKKKKEMEDFPNKLFGGFAVKTKEIPGVGGAPSTYEDIKYYKWMPSSWSVTAGFKRSFWCEFQLPYNPYLEGEDEHKFAKTPFASHFAINGLATGSISGAASTTTGKNDLSNFIKPGAHKVSKETKPDLQYYRVARIRDACGPFGVRSTYAEADSFNSLSTWLTGDKKSACDNWEDMYGKKTGKVKAIAWRLPRFDYEFLKSFMECTGPVRTLKQEDVCRVNVASKSANSGRAGCEVGMIAANAAMLLLGGGDKSLQCLVGDLVNKVEEKVKKIADKITNFLKKDSVQKIADIYNKSLDVVKPLAEGNIGAALTGAMNFSTQYLNFDAGKFLTESATNLGIDPSLYDVDFNATPPKVTLKGYPGVVAEELTSLVGQLPTKAEAETFLKKQANEISAEISGVPEMTQGIKNMAYDAFEGTITEIQKKKIEFAVVHVDLANGNVGFYGPKLDPNTGIEMRDPVTNDVIYENYPDIANKYYSKFNFDDARNSILPIIQASTGQIDFKQPADVVATAQYWAENLDQAFKTIVTAPSSKILSGTSVKIYKYNGSQKIYTISPPTLEHSIVGRYVIFKGTGNGEFEDISHTASTEEKKQLEELRAAIASLPKIDLAAIGAKIEDITNFADKYKDGCMACTKGNSSSTKAIVDSALKAADFGTRGDTTFGTRGTTNIGDLAYFDENGSAQIKDFWLKWYNPVSKMTEKRNADEPFGFWCTCPPDKPVTTRCREDYCTFQQHVLLVGRNAEFIEKMQKSIKDATKKIKDEDGGDETKMEGVNNSVDANAADATKKFGIAPVAISKFYGPYLRWLQCFYQARAKSCPVLTRDVSEETAPSTALDPFAKDKEVRKNYAQQSTKEGGTAINVCTASSPTGSAIAAAKTAFGSSTIINNIVDSSKPFLRWTKEEPNHLARIPIIAENSGGYFRHQDFVFQSQARDYTFPFLELAAPFPIDLITRDCDGYEELSYNTDDVQDTTGKIKKQVCKNKNANVASGATYGGSTISEHRRTNAMAELKQRGGTYGYIVHYDTRDTLTSTAFANINELNQPLTTLTTSLVTKADRSMIQPSAADSDGYKSLYEKYIKALYAINRGNIYSGNSGTPAHPKVMADINDILKYGPTMSPPQSLSLAQVAIDAISRPHPRAQEAVVGPYGCDIGGWYEMMLYQARCISWMKLNCICDYDKTFARGNAVNYAYKRAGGVIQVVEPVYAGKAKRGLIANLFDKSQINGSDSMRDSSSNNPYAGGDAMKFSQTGTSYDNAKIIEKITPYVIPLADRGNMGPDFSRKTNLNKDKHFLKGLDNVQVGDIIMWDERVNYIEKDPADATKQTWIDAGYPRHVAYVTKVNRVNSIKVSNLSTTNAVLSFEIKEMNWGKNLDSCGNTDMWGRETSRTIFRPICSLQDPSCDNKMWRELVKAPMTSLTTHASGVSINAASLVNLTLGTINKYASCQNADWKVCVERNWDEVNIYRPYYFNLTKQKIAGIETGKLEIAANPAGGLAFPDSAYTCTPASTSTTFPKPITESVLQDIASRYPNASNFKLKNKKTGLEVYNLEAIRKDIYKRYPTSNSLVGLAKRAQFQTEIADTEFRKLLVTKYGVYDKKEIETYFNSSLGGAIGRCDLPPELRNDYQAVLEDSAQKIGMSLKNIVVNKALEKLCELNPYRSYTAGMNFLQGICP